MQIFYGMQREKKERKSWKVTFEKKHTRDVSKLEFTLLDYNYTSAIIEGEHGMGPDLPQRSPQEPSPSHQHLPAGGQNCVSRGEASNQPDQSTCQHKEP